MTPILTWIDRWQNAVVPVNWEACKWAARRGVAEVSELDEERVSVDFDHVMHASQLLGRDAAPASL